MTRATPLQIEAPKMTAAMVLGKKAARRLQAKSEHQKTFKAMPDDFREHSSDPVKDLVLRYGAGKNVIARWRKELGIYPRRVKITLQIADVIRLSEKGLTVEQIGYNLGVGRRAVMGAAKRAGYELPSHKGGRQANGLPADFAAKFHLMSVEALADYYHRSQKTISAWATKAGLKRVRPPMVRADRLSRARPVSAPKPIVKSYAAPRLVTHHKGTIREIWRDSTEAGKAQEILQRDKWAVYRCDESGRQDVTGKLWRCGRVIVTDAELIERAARVTARMGRVGV